MSSKLKKRTNAGVKNKSSKKIGRSGSHKKRSESPERQVRWSRTGLYDYTASPDSRRRREDSDSENDSKESPAGAHLAGEIAKKLQIGRIIYFMKAGPNIAGAILMKLGITPNDVVLPGITFTALSYIGGVYLTRMLYHLLRYMMEMSYHGYQLYNIKTNFYGDIRRSANPSELLSIVTCIAADEKVLMAAAGDARKIIKGSMADAISDVTALLQIGRASCRERV